MTSAAAHLGAAERLALAEKVLDQMPPFVGVAVECRREARGWHRTPGLRGPCCRLKQVLGRLKRRASLGLILRSDRGTEGDCFIDGSGASRRRHRNAPMWCLFKPSTQPPSIPLRACVRQPTKPKTSQRSGLPTRGPIGSSGLLRARRSIAPRLGWERI